MRTGAERELPSAVKTQLKATPAVFIFIFVSLFSPAVDPGSFSGARAAPVLF